MVKSKTSLQREVAKLKERKKKALKSKKDLIYRQREINEIKELEREIDFLKGVGTKKRLAREVSMKMGKHAGQLGWKGLKNVGKFVKNVIEAEARDQARDRARENKPSPRPRVMAKVKNRPVQKRKPKPKRRVRAKVKNGRRR